MNEKKLGISHPWYSRTMNSNVHSELWIREYIEGLLLNYKFLTSEVFVQVYPKKVSLKFLVFVGKRNPSWLYCLVYLPRLIKLIKSVLTLGYNKNIHVSIKVVGSVFEDDKVLSGLIRDRIVSNPFQFRQVLKKIFDQFKQKGHKKNWEKVMSKYTGKKRRFKKKGILSGRSRASEMSRTVVSK